MQREGGGGGEDIGERRSLAAMVRHGTSDARPAAHAAAWPRSPPPLPWESKIRPDHAPESPQLIGSMISHPRDPACSLARLKIELVRLADKLDQNIYIIINFSLILK
jgi:hypothetical protein